MSKVVIDTSVFVGACLGTGAANAMVELCLLDRLQPVMGTALFTEYEAVMSRDTLFRNCRLSHSERNELLDAFLSTCEWVEIYYGWRPNLQDEGDNHLVELAVAGACTHIITKNIRDFQQASLHFDNIRICTPETYLKEIKQ